MSDPETLFHMIKRYGDLRESVTIEAECGSPAVADEIADRAHELLRAIEIRVYDLEVRAE